MKKVSVIIPAYNKAEFTLRTIDSVLNQTYTNIEIIVVDDGSTDDTKIKLKRYGNKINYIFKENGGACSARNIGIKKATGEYVAFLDCDDIYYPEKISLCVECLNNNLEYGFVYTGAYFIDENDEIVSEYANFEYNNSGRIAQKLIEKDIICNSTVVARRECFKKAGYFDENIFIPADWDMWLRLAELFKAGYIDKNLTGYRISDTYTIHNLEKGMKEEIYVLNKTFERNLISSRILKYRCFSNVFYRYGLMNSAKGNFKRSRSLLIKAFIRKPYSIKLILLVCISLIFPKLLYLLLGRKIVV